MKISAGMRSRVGHVGRPLRESPRPERKLLCPVLAAWLVMASFAALLPALVAISAEVMETAKLVPSDAGFNDQFGISVAVDGDTAMLGANLDFVNGGFNAGSAYVFRHNGSEWVQLEKLIASDSEQFDQFGISVAISGDLAVVGAYLSDDGGRSTGSAYVFRDNGSNWLEEGKLNASDPEAGDQFGYSVAVSGNTIMVGAIGDASDAGAVYVFRYDEMGMVWLEESILIASDAAADDEFGFSVAVDADTAVVGARLDDAPMSDSGSAYVFHDNGSAWLEHTKLTALDAASGDQFGYSVGVSGNTAVVGAHLDDNPGLNPGSAYVFRNQGAGWFQQAKLGPSNPSAGNRFGIAVGVDGDTVVIGADDISGVFGSAYVFRYDATAMDWLEEGKLEASDNAPGDHFGGSLAITGDTAVVGAFEDASDAGSAYVFLLPDPVSPVPEPHPLLALIPGFALLGLLDRRRRARPSAMRSRRN